MRVLEGFSWLVLCSDIENGLFSNRSPLNTVVSRKVMSFSEISAVNFIAGWKLLVCAMLA